MQVASLVELFRPVGSICMYEAVQDAIFGHTYIVYTYMSSATQGW